MKSGPVDIRRRDQITKYGLFATEPCDPGHFVCEFIGHVQVKSLLTVKGARGVPVPVTQSFVLYPFASIELAVDARKFGTGVRYARRSCRPNVQIKPIIVETLSSGDYYLSWGLFARNVIRANSEILLPWIINVEMGCLDMNVPVIHLISVLDP